MGGGGVDLVLGEGSEVVDDNLGGLGLASAGLAGDEDGLGLWVRVGRERSPSEERSLLVSITIFQYRH